MNKLEHLEPASVFYYFQEICKIPHTSYHEKALSDYCVHFAKERGFFCQQDSSGNVIIVAPATSGYEDKETLILQGHLDMVEDKAPGCTLDMEKDGLELFTDGDFIRANGTSLGADNGIAIAYALALLDAKDIAHPRLEVIFTVCEEVGLIGASALDLSICQGRKMLNLDSEVEGLLTVGCAGGRRAALRFPLDRISSKGIACQVLLSGLTGGHSGLEIHKGRANANALIGRFLLFLKEEIPFSFVSVQGGSKENVIPKQAEAILLLPEDTLEKTRELVSRFQQQMKIEYGTTDPQILLTMKEDGFTECSVLTDTSLNTILTAITNIPTGVQAMSADLADVVETSINFGVLECSQNELCIRTSIRSSVVSAKEALSQRLAHLAAFLGGTIEFHGDYPAWPYVKESSLRERCIELFQKQYNKKPELLCMHAGLECGIFSDKLPGLECISFGPDLIDVHSHQERASISSIARVWEYLKLLLAEL